MMRRAYYSDAITDFLKSGKDAIIGQLVAGRGADQTQNRAWDAQIEIMQNALAHYGGRGKIYFEYDIPRLGRRIDVLAVIDNVIFVLEFKVGADRYESHAVDQVCDYALDLKNFHQTSHRPIVAPVLVATDAANGACCVMKTPQNDNLLCPMKTNAEGIAAVIDTVLEFEKGDAIVAEKWERGGYSPTPTIIEAATALYGGHSVEDISRTDASAINLSQTSGAIEKIIRHSKTKGHKAICFLTGVPGAGKTLVGLNIAARHNDKDSKVYSVFLSGNGPLVDILREALARDKTRRERENGNAGFRLGQARSEVKALIQNVHHFRDDCLRDSNPPHEHVALFDEAQRAWDKSQTTNFMRRRKGIPDFNKSEPEFLISCLHRHSDWAVVVCLVGGGQEINTGEAGISGWIDALIDKFPDWHVYVSSRLTDDEYAAGRALVSLKEGKRAVHVKDELHLSTSMRSFRAENVSLLVKKVLDLETDQAQKIFNKSVIKKYPMVLTRNLDTAKDWLRSQARGSERYGIVVSSRAERLRPHAIHVKAPMKPVNWFLDAKDDVRSSYYLEDVATEFHVQGLEVDWACLTWDADFRYGENGWEHWEFRGSRWNHVHNQQNQLYQKNAYRVLLTRARQGMVIFVPKGDSADPTRDKSYYDPTFNYLRSIGFGVL